MSQRKNKSRYQEEKIMNFINYDYTDLKSKVRQVDGFGSYLIVDNFIEYEFFKKLNKDLLPIKKEWKKYCKHISEGEIGNGQDRTIGGGGSQIDKFKSITNTSDCWKDFIETMYSEQFKRMVFDIWEDTELYESLCKDYRASVMSCKISMQTNDYGWPIHQDSNWKVISFLLYLDNVGWDDNSSGGTDLYRVSDNQISWNTNENSMDYQMRKGQFSRRLASLNVNHVDYLQKIESIKFKPNRLVGFIKTDVSYHSIPPRKLPNGITRDCFQINVKK
tara:strand:+ start:76 stop:903 length:828 start_codon:yes stop_codon:yes gene_type:complete